MATQPKRRRGDASDAQLSYLNGLRAQFGLGETEVRTAKAVGREIDHYKARYHAECEVPRLREALRTIALRAYTADPQRISDFALDVLCRKPHGACDHCDGSGCPACTTYDERLLPPLGA